MRSIVVTVVCLALASATSHAATPEERCEAFQLTGAGKRILGKLRCRARAKLDGTEISAKCLDKAEKRYFKHLAKAGPECLVPDDIVTRGAEADADMSAIVESVEPAAATIPDVSGTWETRTILRIDPNGGASLDCQYYAPGQCPVGDLLAITDCVTEMQQTGSTFTQTSQCTTPAESPVKLGSFAQSGSGTVDPVTGEWTLEGSVTVPGFTTYFYQGEGVYAPDGQTMTGFTTAGFTSGQSLWLATTTGQRVD